jgi:hypothetical protein
MLELFGFHPYMESTYIFVDLFEHMLIFLIWYAFQW